jgi:PPOX class probable FMN-dependent enzyme
MTHDPHRITSAAELDALYGPLSEVVASKVLAHLDAHCRAFVERSPFVLLATADASGRCDVSPRGGAPGFVEVSGERGLAVPDLPGNRMLDSCRNILETGHAGLLFVIPGREETLRVNGRAHVTRDPALLARLAGRGKPPRVAIGIDVQEAFLHCAKAFRRSSLWQPEHWPDLDGLARAAQVWRDHVALPGLTTERMQSLTDEDYAENLEWH